MVAPPEEGSSIRDIKIISKDINFELWPHNVATMPQTVWYISICPCGCASEWFGKRDCRSILNQIRWGSAVLCAKCFHYNYRQFQASTVVPVEHLLSLPPLDALQLAEMAI